MKRGVTLISVAITAFSVVIMVSVVYGYRVNAGPQSAKESAQESAPVSAREPRPSAELVSAATTVSTRISPRMAAGIAAEFLGRTDPYSVQLVQYNGLEAYKVAFLSGDVVYVSPAGQILGSELPTIQLASSNGARRDDRDRSSDDHEDDEHEEHEEEHEEGG